MWVKEFRIGGGAMCLTANQPKRSHRLHALIGSFAVLTSHQEAATKAWRFKLPIRQIPNES